MIGMHLNAPLRADDRPTLVAATDAAELYEYPGGSWVLHVDAARFRVTAVADLFKQADREAVTFDPVANAREALDQGAAALMLGMGQIS